MAFLNTVATTAWGISQAAELTQITEPDVLNMVTMVEPYAVPFVEMLPKRTTESTIHQYAIETLPALFTQSTTGIDVDGINISGIDEGFDPSWTTNYPYTTGVSDTPTRLTNFVQYFAGKVGISDVTMRQKHIPGIPDPETRQIFKVGKVIGKAIERRILDNPSYNASYVAGASSGVMKLKPLHDLIGGSPNVQQVTAAGVLTPDIIDAGMEAVYNASNEMPEYVICSAGSKMDVSARLRGYAGFTTAGYGFNVSNIDAAERRIIRGVDIYDGDLGPVAFLVTRQLPFSSSLTGGGRAWLCNRSLLGLATYEPMHYIKLAKTGHNTKGILVTGVTTEYLAPPSLCVILNVTT